MMPADNITYAVWTLRTYKLLIHTALGLTGDSSVFCASR